jgi:hypothetical protein
MSILYLLLGWLIGIISPGIAERIRREHRRRELVRSILSELTALQYMMAIVAHVMRGKLATVTDEFLDWIAPIVARYDGPEKPKGQEEALAKTRKISEQQRREVDLYINSRKGRGLALKQYSLPFLQSVSNELPICSLDFQRRVLHVKGRLDVFNQHTSFLQAQFNKTFEVTDGDYESVTTNLSEGYSQLAAIAEGIANAIAEIESLFRP